MTKTEFQEILKSPEYDFLRTDPHLGSNILLLTLGGSHSFGTNQEGSDVDVRGITAMSRDDLLGFGTFEQYKDSETDTTVYGLNKAASLLLACNPHALNMLGCKPEHYAYISSLGQLLIDNRKVFLSQKAYTTYSKYSSQALVRLKNNLARHRSTVDEKEQHLLDSLLSSMKHCNERFQNFPDGSIRLYIDKSEKTGRDTEIFMDVSLSHYPLRDYKGLWGEMNDLAKNFDSLNSRNKKKDDLHVNKHLMHLVLLKLMARDLLATGDIVTFRENDIPFLLDIRHGKFMDAEGKVLPEFFELLSSLDREVEYAKEHSVLPVEPDRKKASELIAEINYQTLHR